jgi:hypothetical protein
MEEEPSETESETRNGDRGRGGEQREEEERREDTRGSAGKAIKILYLNAQSIVRKTDELAGVASTLLPVLILITETWCHSDISDAYLSINGYEVQADLRLDRQDTAHGRGGGLLVLCTQWSEGFKNRPEHKFPPVL